MTSSIEPMKRCPFCAEEIRAAALKCKHCGSMLPAEKPTRPQSDDTFAVLALSVPVIAAGFIWFWIGQMTAAEDPAGKLFWLSIAMAVISSVLIAIDAYRAGSGRGDKLDSHWAMWLMGPLIFWIIGFPAWFKARAGFGRTRMLGWSLAAMAVYFAAPAGLIARDELAKREANRQMAMRLDGLAPNVGPPAQAPTVDYAAVTDRYLSDRDAVRRAKPKTEDDVVRVLGRRPDDIVESSGFTILQWLYDTSEMNRDVIQVTMQGGKITLMNL